MRIHARTADVKSVNTTGRTFERLTVAEHGRIICVRHTCGYFRDYTIPQSIKTWLIVNILSMGYPQGDWSPSTFHLNASTGGNSSISPGFRISSAPLPDSESVVWASTVGPSLWSSWPPRSLTSTELSEGMAKVRQVWYFAYWLRWRPSTRNPGEPQRESNNKYNARGFLDYGLLRGRITADPPNMAGCLSRYWTWYITS